MAKDNDSDDFLDVGAQLHEHPEMAIFAWYFAYPLSQVWWVVIATF